MFKKSLLIMMLMALLAPWAAAQTRVTQTFDFEDNAIPSGWINDATYPWVTTTDAANTGTYSIKSGNAGVNSSTSSITATFTFAGDGTISFAARCSCEQTNPSYDWDYGTFSIDGVQQGTKIINSDTFTTYEYDVEAGQHTFVWKYKKDSSVGNNDDCLYVDDVVVDLGVAPSCPKPHNLACTATTGTPTTATFTWTNGDTETNWVLEYGTNSDFTEATSIDINDSELVSGAYTLTTGLTAETQYYAHIKADCGGDESDWSNTINFKPSDEFCNEIGTGSSSAYLVYTSYGCTYSQHIYTADELTAMGFVTGNIVSVSFDYSGSSSSYQKTQSIYIGTTTKSSYSDYSASDFESNVTLVYGPTQLSYVAGWREYELTEPFEWDGTSNIVVGMLTNGNNQSSSTGWSANGTSTSPDIRTICRYQDSNPIDITNLASVSYGKSATIRPNINLCILASKTPKPKNLHTGEITAETAELIWEEPNITPLRYEYQYKADGGEYNPLQNTTNLSVEIGALTESTDYVFRVRAVYSEGNSDFVELSFQTLASCAIPFNLEAADETAHGATLTWSGNSDSYNVKVGEVLENITFSADFEGGTLPSDFTTTTSYPWTVVANDHSGAYCAKSGNGGVDDSTSDMVLEVTVTETSQLTFSAKVSSESNWDKAYFTIDGTAQSNLNGISGNGNWIDYSYTLAAGTHTLRWYYYKDSSTASNDDCFYVDDIKVANSYVGSWITYNAPASPYVLYDATDIHAETEYQVKVIGVCGSIETDPSEIISFTTTATCPAPTDLEHGTPEAHSIELSWTENGTATSWQICINGNETNLVDADSNPFTLPGLASETAYTVKVRAFCDEDDQSYWSNTVSFSTAVACPRPTGLTQSNVTITSVDLSWTENGTATSWQICINGDTDNLVDVDENPYTLGGLTPDTDYNVKVRAYCDAIDQSSWSNIVTFTTPEACAKPTNLTESNITTESATLSWTGTSDNYVLQYRPWFQVGEDQLSTAEFVTYTYDLSEYKGQGSIAIRHYDVSDKFYLNVDNVELRDSDDAIIFTEDFESGTIPSTWTNYDVDGDGYTWDMASSANMSVIGNYGVYSASWISGVGALHPDNWLIISNVPMGGTFSFAARGQDPSYPDENFAVYVSLESDITEIPVAGTTYKATNLTPGTPYAWQVKSDCGEYQSNWVTSLFKTVDDLLVFANDGAWDNIDNWEDVDGNPAENLPTIDNKVRIDAEAIIPAGVVATAGKTTISDGASLTIKDGGQLKHNSATLWVTMEKDITGVGSTNWDDDEYSKGWYFISTPFSGTTEIEQDGDWSHVQNIITTTSAYDLYAFNSTEALEWVNYKDDPENSEFVAGNNQGLVFKRGYLYANEADVTMEFTGTISKSINNTMTDAHNYDPTSTTNLFNGFKLVGNPFSCNGYLTFTPSGDDPTDVDFYVMNQDGDGFELSETHVAIAPLQGAFFYADAEGTINFSSDVPNSKRGNGALNINLTQNGKVADMARIRFGEGMRLAKYQLNESSKIYFTQEDKDYAVVHTQAQGEMPLNFKAETTGQYTISFKLDGTNVGYLHLIDKATSEDINLLTNPEYSFIGSTRDEEDRFIIRFNETSANDFFVYQSGDQLIVNGEGTLQVYDVMGRFVASYNISGTESISASQFENAVYIFRLVGTDVKTQKIVVR